MRRETALGRWGPVIFYALIVATWFLDGLRAGVGDRLWLVVVALPAVVLYVWRTRGTPS